MVQCDICEEDRCRRCGEVRCCPGCERVLCDVCVKKEYCPACKTVPYCVECLARHLGYCSKFCRREDHDYHSSDSESNSYVSSEESLSGVEEEES